MKIVSRNIYEFEEDEYMLAIRDKLQYLKLVLITTRLLLNNENFKKKASQCYLKLKIGKMTRIFIYKGEKFFSFAFPFNVLLKNQVVLRISTYSGVPVDGQTISSALSLLTTSSSIIEALTLESDEENFFFDNLGKNLLEELIMFEPGYLRYDKDIANANGKLHPVNHIDINFSSYGTYKIGLSSDIVENQFEDITNIETNCSFLSF